MFHLIYTRFQEARNGLSSSSGGVGTKGTPRQLVLLLSDGRFDRENKDRLRKLVREMNERGQLLVLIGKYVGGYLVRSDSIVAEQAFAM